MPAYDPLRATVDSQLPQLRCPCPMRSAVVKTFSQDGWQSWITCLTCHGRIEPVQAEEDQP
jgi:hypothetical protein